MRKLLSFVFVVWCTVAPVKALAGSMTLLGVGKAPAAAYQGPGDVVSGSTAWGSCARVYNASLASTSTSLCDLVAVTGGAAVCTLRGSSTGFVDLAASYCAGTTPGAACAAASGGSCKVSKVYDQTGNGAHFTEATLSNMPGLSFSALGGLPCMSFVRANTSRLTSANNFTTTNYSVSVVGARTGSQTLVNILAAFKVTNSNALGFNNATNTALLYAGASITAAATDGSFHAFQGVNNGASSALVVDGSATSGSNGGGASGGVPMTIGATGATASANPLDGSICEFGIWPTTVFNATQYGNMNANQHGSNGYSF